MSSGARPGGRKQTRPRSTGPQNHRSVFMTCKLKPIEEQVIVVTGASSGIGLCTALLAAERGASVVLIARSGPYLEALAEQIRAAGGKAVAVEADVADRAALDQAALFAIAT